MNRIPRGHQKNKINLVLDNSELDIFEDLIKSLPIVSNPIHMKNYILEQINKARLKNDKKNKI